MRGHLPDIERTRARIHEIVRVTWGHDRLRPLQEEAIVAGLDRKDSLVVLPTGGGKSLCYQVPPLLAERTDIVVSPLISLMKDQVDALLACGYPATALHSGLSTRERREAERFVASGGCRLAFVAPERLLGTGFLDRIGGVPIGAFAIDEAHCISHWGHDFRPEYRQLAVLKERFPGVSLHAYTATATERVRSDIVEQLRLDDPRILVGRFDRPNLVYRVVPRTDLRRQADEVLERHEREAVIVYCLSRSDTESLASHLEKRGRRVAFYHAGMTAEARRRTQDAFSREEIDVIVATVAFGMGIDRSDVRCVLHAAMPRSIEHYQQETGRAGRDGLEAECVLLYSPADVLRWKSLIDRTAEEAGDSTTAAAAEDHLEEMRRFCSPGRCRHKLLSEHFGQRYEAADCGACDVCLGECEELEDGTDRARMILSCVARTGQRFGAGHVVDVLRGAESDRILALRHHELSTYALLAKTSKKELTSLVYQLVDQGLLDRTGRDYPVLVLNDASWEVLRGERSVRFLPTASAKKRRVRKTAFARDSWEGVDTDLFESLRDLRAEIALERGVPPYVIFNDASLQDMARRKPADRESFLAVHGVGRKKLEDLGDRFLARIAACRGLDP